MYEQRFNFNDIAFFILFSEFQKTHYWFRFPSVCSTIFTLFKIKKIKIFFLSCRASQNTDQVQL